MNLLPLPQIFEGPESLDQLSSWIPKPESAKILIFASPCMIHSGQLQRLKQFLPASAEISVFSDFEGDPSMETAQTAIKLAQSDRFDCVIALGGGSVMDTAKISAALSRADGTIDLDDVIGIDRVMPGTGVPLIAIPTTAGTGSEVTPITILSDAAAGIKKSIISRHLIPSIAILDPSLTTTLPRDQTAYTGIDALVHAMESYLSKKANDYTDALSLRAVELIARHLREAHRNGSNLDARAGLLRGSLLAGIAFSNAGVAAVHALAYPLGGQFKIPHGLANGLMLIPVMAFNESASPVRIATLTRILSDCLGSESLNLEQVLRRLLDSLNFPKSLKEAGIPESALAPMAEKAIAIRRLLENNPRPVSAEQALNLYQSAYAGRS